MAIYSKSTQYAIRALVKLAQAGGNGHARTADVADTTDVPPQFLSKIVQGLTRAGLVESLRGRGGGIRLKRPADQICLEDIVAAVDGEQLTRDCALGLSICSDAAPCPIHHVWKRVRESLVQDLHEQTLADLVSTVNAKQTLLRRSGGDAAGNGRKARNRNGAGERAGTRTSTRTNARTRNGDRTGKRTSRTRKRRPTGQTRGA